MRTIVSIITILTTASFTSAGQIIQNGNHQAAISTSITSRDFSDGPGDIIRKSSSDGIRSHGRTSGAKLTFSKDTPSSQSQYKVDFVYQTSSQALSLINIAKRQSTPFSSVRPLKSPPTEPSTNLAATTGLGLLDDGTVVWEPVTFMFLAAFLLMIPLIWMHGKRIREKE